MRQLLATMLFLLAVASPAQAQQTIEPGQSADGTIDANTPLNKFNERRACWLVKAPAGSLVQIGLTSPDVQLTIFIMKERDCGTGSITTHRYAFIGPGPNAGTLLFNTPKNGEFTVFISNRSKDMPGSAAGPFGVYTLSISAPGGAMAAVSAWRSTGSASTVAGPPATTQPGTEIRDCPECPAMMVLPAGSFLMGSLPTEPERDGLEGPRHAVTFARPFAIGKTEVSFAEWDACHAAGACPSLSDGGWGRGRMPAINVGFDGALKYVAWLSAKTGQRYFLPSEAEWEYAARAGADTPWSTGDAIIGDDANMMGQFRQTVPTGGYPPNGFGLHDMHGNVAEWVQDCMHTGYVGAPADGSANPAGDCAAKRILRGGGFASMPAQTRAAHRGTAQQRRDYGAVGFRVARAL